jgi:glutamyl-tRNA synthetase
MSFKSMMFDKPRVRYAPSPTGEPHVGNIRTALFDWLISKKYDGKFIIREEDTDQARIINGAMNQQEESLRWLGLNWDEGLGTTGDYGPYVQSKRIGLYHEFAEKLLLSGNAYKCFCSKERLDELRGIQNNSKSSFIGYDGKCKNNIGDSYYPKEECVIRFNMPDSGKSVIADLVRGNIEFNNSLMEDFVILKSDCYPTYHFASVIDDHLMRISIVIRGEEWLSSLPRHIQIYEAFGWEIPQFAHLPTILAMDKTKLSKRHGATSILEFKADGYLPEAMINFLSLLGWSIDGEKEIISVTDLIQKFDISTLNSSGAVFDKEKLNWMNGYYIRNKNDYELGNILFEYWQEYPPEVFEWQPTLMETIQIVPLISQRLKTLGEAASWVSFLYKKEIYYDIEELIEKSTVTIAQKVVDIALIELEKLEYFESDKIEELLRTIFFEEEIKTGVFLGIIRLATSGQKISPPIFQSLEILGKQRTLRFLKNCQSLIQVFNTY